MKYENAADILPQELLTQLQKYASGKLLYIPAGKKLSWGESSGYKHYLMNRNNEIRDLFSAGEAIERLVETYALSHETIKKIVYSKKEKLMEYKCTLSSVQAFADAGKLEDWIHIYLLSDGHNKPFSDGLKIYDRYFLGPMTLPLSLFKRCTGPEPDMKYQTPRDSFEAHVSNLRKVLETKEDMPPLISNYVDGRFELNDGNHRFEALTRMGVTEYKFIIWITDAHDHEDFLQKFGHLLDTCPKFL